MALEFVGGALLSAFLQVSFEKLASPEVLNFFRGRKLDQKLLTNLDIKLQSIHALADDAEQKQFRDLRVRNWLLKVKDVVLDAEDLLDEIQHKLSKGEDDAKSKSQTCTCKVPNFFKSFAVSSFNKEVKTRMEQVLESLEILSSQQGALGLKNVSSVGVGSGLGSEASHKSQSTSLIVESVIYGRDEDKEIIINWLTSAAENGNKLSILSIVGMGGLGKTSLARHVYNDPRIEGKFDIKAWVCVSDDFSAFKVTKTILEAITKSTDDSSNLQMVHERLEENLKGKKLLLVLDDVWNEKREEWEVVLTPLINFAAQGSRILATTRSTKVASTMRSKEHHLQLLQEDYCWQLFAEHAFQNANPESNPDFKEISMKIIKKCKGLPLALKTIGSLLHNKSIWEWKSILQNEIWELEDSDIVPALALSYHHLPSHLKICFAYCSLFPKDYEFDKECLIQLWMAQKFLQCPHRSNKSPEEVGEQYFNGLLSRCFFQQSSFMGKRCFVMHDLLHDLAKYVCGDNCFRFEVDEAKDIPKLTRHFSIAINHVQHFNGFGTLYDTTRLRTFLPTSERMDSLDYSWHCKMSISELFSTCKFLRVLSLSCCSKLIKVPESIGNLIHLHSLDLSRTDIEELPESTCSLYNLQILKLNCCEHLKELPSNLHKLIDLRRLEIIETELRKVPPHLGKLKNLQVLMSSFNVGESSEFTIQQLGELNLRGSLSIENLQNIENFSDAVAMNLKNKARLVELELKWNESVIDDSVRGRDEIVIENLQPSKNLEKLSIRHYGGKQFPCWLSDNLLWNIVSLTLEDCQSCQRLPSLGVLPLLKDLKISGLDGIVSIDTDFYGSSSCSFTSLETLEFSSMKEWEKWECQALTGAFPRLQHLSIITCPKLKGDLPEQLVNLKKLEIWNCEQLAVSVPMAPKIHELWLQDCGKLQCDYHPTTLKRLTVCGHNMNALLLERIGHMISINSLEYLRVDSCPKMNVPMSGFHSFLVELYIIDGCDSLTTFPLDCFPTLRILFLSRCRNLQMISQDHVHNYLEYLTILKCPKLESLPKRMHMLLPSLYSLSARGFRKVDSLCDVGFPSNLKRLSLLNVSSKHISSLKKVLGDNSSIEYFDIGNLDDAESLPEEGLLPLSLTRLRIINCSNLKRLDYKGLCHLSSLKELCLRNCPNLQSLPDEGLPKSISTLQIKGNCPLLKHRCRKPEGEDWPKIAHIQHLYIR